MSDPWLPWRRMCECVTVVGQMPVRFELRDMYWETLELDADNRADLDERVNRRAHVPRLSNRPVLHLLLDVPDRDSGDPTTVVFSQELPWDADKWDGHRMLAYLRGRLVDAYLHELDESIRIGDVRPFDPHKPKLTCADALKLLLEGEPVNERPVDAPYDPIPYDDRAEDRRQVEQKLDLARKNARRTP